MAEVNFAKTFLSALDSRPIKLSADHVEDPRNYPARSAQILPRMAKPMSKPTKQAAGAGQAARTVTVHLRSAKNPPVAVTLPSQPLSTSVLDLKKALDAQARLPAAKVKVLLNKKPVPDSKVLKDLLPLAAGDDGADAASEIEFTIMVMGGAAAVRPPSPPPSGVDGNRPPTSATPVAGVETAEFWDDLKGYLMQRLKDEKQAGELHSLFKSSWEAKK